MKSAYELAMERLNAAEPDAPAPLTTAQKERLAQIDLEYQGKIAEREIFLQQKLDEALAAGERREATQIRAQISQARAEFEEDRESAKNRVRRGD